MPLTPVDNALLERLHMSRLQWVHGGATLPLIFCVKEAPEFIFINFDKFWDLNLILIDSAAVAGGAPGSQGPPGIEGEEGEMGLPGPPGGTGATGPVGPAGATGDIGPQGPQGTEGEEGEPGLPGLQGIAGPAGATGATGATGDAGLMGPPGIEGEEGEPGIIGPSGPVGADGAPGAAGATGDTGPIGPPGVEGDEGEMGLPGPPGVAGVAGAAGAPGAAGADGVDGLQGPPGVDGEDGAEVPIPYHPEVTISPDLDTNVMNLTGQQLDLDTQDAEHVFAGPTAGNPPAKPAFRHLLQTDLASDWRNFVETLAREQFYHEYEFDMSGAWTTWTAGSGSVRYNTQHILDISSSNVANSRCLVRHERFAGWQIGVARNQIDWDRRFLLTMLLTPCEGSANGARRVTFGKDHNNVIGDPTNKAIGIQFGPPGIAPGYVTAVTGYAHDGVNLWTLALGNVQGFYTHQFVIINNGDAHVDFWVDGVEIGTIHTGPTGLGTANFCIFQMEVSNAADAAYSILNLHAGRMVFDNA